MTIDLDRALQGIASLTECKKTFTVDNQVMSVQKEAQGYRQNAKSSPGSPH